MAPAQTVAAQAQQVASQIQLPEWLEYVKALGTPVVALTAACIAGVVAFKQWQTASRKLKLDFFDRRLNIYSAATKLAKHVVHPLPLSRQSEIADLSENFSAARWLMDDEVADYLAALRERAYKNMFKRDRRLKGVPEDERMATRFRIIDEDEKALDNEIRALNDLFNNYLQVKH
jgi:hypothetical protein